MGKIQDLFLRLKHFLFQKMNSRIEKKIAERNSEKEKELKAVKDRLITQLNKSHEYRIMLRDYSEKLAEREDSLTQRERNLDLRENNIEDEVKRRVDAANIEVLQKTEKELSELREYKIALHETEIKVLDYVKRREKEDIEVFEEIIADAEKFKKYAPTINFDGFHFEEYIATLLKKNGYESVEVTPKSKDFGADIIAEKDSIKYVFQCKCYASSSVGIDAVQQIHAAKLHYNAHVAVVVTNSVFTKASKILANEINVLLWDCQKISDMVATQE